MNNDSYTSPGIIAQSKPQSQRMEKYDPDNDIIMLKAKVKAYEDYVAILELQIKDFEAMLIDTKTNNKRRNSWS